MNTHGSVDQDDGVFELVSAVLRRAVKDAQQSVDPNLASEAWLFLDVCAPTVAERLRRQQHKFAEKESCTD